MKCCLAITLVLLATAAGGQTLDQGIAAHDAGNLKEAERIFASVSARRSGDVNALVWLGRTLIEQGKVKEAEKPLETAVKLAPDNAEAHFRLGQSYGQQAREANMLMQASLARKVRVEFERTVELDPGHLEARSGLVSFYLEAPAVMGGDVEKARAQALEIRKRDSLAGYRELVRIHVNLEEWKKAEETWREAIAEHPDRTEPLNGLGMFYQQRKFWGKAFATFDAAQKIDSSDLTSLYQIGRTSALSGQSLERGEAALSRYLTMTPGSTNPPLKWAHYRLAEIYALQKKNDQAKAQYRKAIELDPQFKEAKEALKKLG